MDPYDLPLYEHYSGEVLTACGWPSGGRNATMVLGNLIQDAWEGGWLPAFSTDLEVKLLEPLDDAKGTDIIRLDRVPEDVHKTVTIIINGIPRYGLWLHQFLQVEFESVGIYRLGGDRTEVGVKRGAQQTTISPHRVGASVWIRKMTDLPGEQGINGTMDRKQFDFLVEHLTPMRQNELAKQRERVERNKAKQREQAQKEDEEEKAKQREQAQKEDEANEQGEAEDKEKRRREVAIWEAMKTYTGPFNRRGYPKNKPFRAHSGIMDVTKKEKRRIWWDGVGR